MKKAWLIGCGQWGSSGKGLIAAHLAFEWEPDLATCNFGPNAGHTWVSESGEKVIVKQLPMAIVSESVKTILIGPGSIVDPEIFLSELEKFSKYLTNKEILIHERAAVCLPEHKALEKSSLASISSTFQGTGAAAAAKVLRKPNAIAGKCKELAEYTIDTKTYLNLMNAAKKVQIESAQGLELGLNSGSHYPYCTGRDVTPQQTMADVLWSYRVVPEVIVVMRTYPIRVGDQYIDGVKVGTSGPVYPDQEELTWEQLGVDEERTTVTNKVRRVFSWSWQNLEKVRSIWQPNHIFLNFMNYMFKGATSVHNMPPAAWGFIANVEAQSGSQVRWVGFGPKTSNISQIGG